MSYFKTKGALKTLNFKGFGGMNTESSKREGIQAELVENFRVLPDKSLEKRFGYRYFASFINPIRAVYTGYIDSSFVFYVLSGDLLYKCDETTGDATLIKKIGTKTGEANFFYYYGHLYLLDGEEIYDISGLKVKIAQGYVPLYGKDWRDAYPGEINEPLNLLTPKARISYIIGDPPTIFLNTVHSVSSVEAVYVNGELIDSGRYSIDDNFKTINVTGLMPGDRALVYLTFDDSVTDRAKFALNTNATVFGGIFNSRVFMWGGEKKNVMFSSRHISEESFKISEEISDGAGSLYFPADQEFSVGDGRYAITAVSRHYDRLLIFTEGETWMADSDSCGLDEFPVMRINVDMGCISSRACTKLGNDPITVANGSILRWTSNTDELEDCNAYSISDKIKGSLSEEFFSSAVAYTNKSRGEVYFTDKTNGAERLFVYGTENQQWYIYTNVSADMFFDLRESTAFVSDRIIYVFDDSYSYDLKMNVGEPIKTLYSTGMLDFGIPERKKRLKGVNIVGEFSDNTFTIDFLSDNNVQTSFSFLGESSKPIQSHSSRLNSDKFVTCGITFGSEDRLPQRIYSMTATVKE